MTSAIAQALEALKALEAHHVELNNIALRDSTQSNTLRLVRVAIAALEFAQAEPRYSVEEVLDAYFQEHRYGSEAPQYCIRFTQRRLAAQTKEVKP